MYNVNDIFHIFIGRRGEVNARTVEIDVRPMLEEFPGSSITLIMNRVGDELPYLCDTTVTDGILSWPIGAADVSVAGEHKIEVRCSDGDVLLKSKTGFAQVARAVGDTVSTETPESVQTWIDALAMKLAEETEYAEQAAHSADIALWMAGQAGSALASAEILNDESARSAAAAKDSEEAAAESEEAAAESAGAAEAEKDEAIRIVNAYGQTVAAAAVAADEAVRAAQDAQGSAEAAAASAADADDSAGDAADSAQAAAGSVTDAQGHADAAAQSEAKAFYWYEQGIAAVTAAGISEDVAVRAAAAAAVSESNAAESELAAKGYAESITPCTADDLAYILGR